MRTARLGIEKLAFVVWLVILPAVIQNAHPFEGHGAHGRMVVLFVAVQMHLIKELGPWRVRDGLAGEFVKGLSQEFGAGATHPSGRTVAAGDLGRRDAAERLQISSRGVGFPAGAEGGNQTRDGSPSGTWKGGEQRGIGMFGGDCVDALVQSGDVLSENADHTGERLGSSVAGFDDDFIGDGGNRRINQLDALLDELFFAASVRHQEAAQGARMTTLQLAQDGPASQQVGDQGRVQLTEPGAELGKVLLDAGGEAQDGVDLLLDEIAPRLDQELEEPSRFGFGREGRKCSR